MSTADVIALAKAGTSYSEIAAQTNKTVRAVSMAILRARRKGVDIPMRQVPRTRPKNPPLTDRQIAEIAVRARLGHKISAIAKSMGLPAGTVSGRMAMLRAEGRLEYRYEGAR